MKNPITTLHIQNFKTIKDLKVKCKRINIIIGKPNVGKSNFLEALSLLGGTYSINTDKFLGEFVRYNDFEDLFYDKKIEESIKVITNIGAAYIRSIDKPYTPMVYEFFLGPNYESLIETIHQLNLVSASFSNSIFNEREGQQSDLWYFGVGKIDNDGVASQYKLSKWNSPVKKYEFEKGIESTSRFHEFLLPPVGENIYTILNRNKKLFPLISSFFKEYKLKFVMRPEEAKFEVQKLVRGFVYSTAYNLIADTLQRIIFNLVAIHSNRETVLLFEEPEAHSFPPYVKIFAENVIESKANQFFITTHSPFILNTIIEKTPREEVAVFIASYDKYQTTLCELSQKEIEDMLNYGNDIFFSPKVLG